MTKMLRLLISMSGSSRSSSSCGGLGLCGGVGVGGDPSAFGMTSSVAMLVLSFIWTSWTGNRAPISNWIGRCGLVYILLR